MVELLTNLDPVQSLLLGGLLGAVLMALGIWTWLHQQRQKRLEETLRLKRSLRHTQVQLDQARKNAEALEVEVLEWRRRSALRSPRGSGSSRFASQGANSEPEAWVIGALLDDGGRASSGFADTQILPAGAH